MCSDSTSSDCGVRKICCMVVILRSSLMSDLQYIRTTCLGSSFFTKSWHAVVVLEYVDVEPRCNIYGG